MAGSGRVGSVSAVTAPPPPPASVLQRQARALGDPTRYKIFHRVAISPEPVGVAALAQEFGLNHNAVRQHLAKLCEAGLLSEEVSARSAPGRRPFLYRLSPLAAGTWGTPGPYQQLAELLLEMLTSGRPAREVGADAGRRALEPDGNTDPLDRLEAEAARRGFEPERVERGRTVRLVLQRCPFDAAAAEHGEVVCDLHLGLVEGLVEAAGGLEVTGLARQDPRKGGCQLKLRRLAGA